jgi:hypothetical protein
MDNILGRGDGSYLKQALLQEGFDNVLTLATIDDDMVPMLAYTDEANITTPINRGDIGLVRTLCKFVGHCAADGKDVENGWLDVPAEEFNNFRVLYISAILGNTAITTAGLPGVATPARSSVDTFLKGVKRDASAFLVLKDEKLNDEWHRSMINVARLQGVERVFNPDYVPANPDELALFQEMQKYVYAVLAATLCTDRGKAFIREHEDDFDAQTVYTKVLAHHRTSTKAQINASDILTYLTSTRIGNNEWQGTVEGYILHWLNQIRADPQDRITEPVRKALLENAMHSNADLRQVKENAAMHQTHTGRALTYDKYCNLLLSAAVSYDAQVQAKRGKRQVLMHDFALAEQYEDWYGNGGDDYDIDVPVGVIQANAMNRARARLSGCPPNRAAMLPQEVYKALPTVDQQAWRQLSEPARVSIVASIQPTGVGNQAGPTTGSLQANVHDMAIPGPTATDIPAIADQPNCNEQPIDDTPNILVNTVSTGTKLPPGDIRRVMSKASVRNVSMADITYTVSSHRLSPAPSLVDRGANGGIAGDDVRFIRQGWQTAEIRGIDGYQLGGVEVGTVGGVVETRQGPIIAIFNQYVLLGRGPSVHSATQLEHYQNEVNDRSIHAGGSQCVRTSSGHVLPLDIHNGLPRLTLRPYTGDEWETLPRVTMTSENDWDPSVMDHMMIGEDPTSDGEQPAEMSFPSPPTHDVNSNTLLCGETADGEGSTQTVSSTFVGVVTGTGDGENNELDNGIPTQGGMTPSDLRRITSKFGPATTKRLLAGTTGHSFAVGRIDHADAFTTPMKNGKGETIQLTSSLKYSSDATVHQPMPLMASNSIPGDEQRGQRELFNHILNNVIGRGDNSVLKQAVLQEGFNSLPSLVAMDERLIGTLSFFRDGHPTSMLTTVSEDDANLIRAFRLFVESRDKQGKSLDSDWWQVTGNDFEMFRYQQSPESQWEPTIAPMVDDSGELSTLPIFQDRGLSPTPFSIFNQDASTLVTLPATSMNGATLDDNRDTGLDYSPIRLEDLLNKAFQAGVERGATLMDTHAHDSTGLPFGIDDLLAKTIAFGEAYAKFTQLIALCCSPNNGHLTGDLQLDDMPDTGDGTTVIHTPEDSIIGRPTPMVMNGKPVKNHETPVLKGILRASTYAVKPKVLYASQSPTSGETMGSPFPLGPGNYSKPTQEPTMEMMLENPILLSSWKYPKGVTTTNFVASHPLNRTHQGDVTDSNPKVKMRANTPWCVADSQYYEHPTSNEWGVSNMQQV